MPTIGFFKPTFQKQQQTRTEDLCKTNCKLLKVASNTHFPSSYDLWHSSFFLHHQQDPHCPDHCPMPNYRNYKQDNALPPTLKLLSGHELNFLGTDPRTRIQSSHSMFRVQYSRCIHHLFCLQIWGALWKISCCHETQTLWNLNYFNPCLLPKTSSSIRKGSSLHCKTLSLWLILQWNQVKAEYQTPIFHRKIKICKNIHL